MIIGYDISEGSGRRYWFADFSLTDVMKLYHASRHRAFLEGTRMEGYRVYFQILVETSARMKPTNYYNFLPTNEEYGEEGFSIIGPGVVKLSVEVGCAGTYIVYDQYKKPRRVMSVRVGNARPRPNKCS